MDIMHYVTHDKNKITITLKVIKKGSFFYSKVVFEVLDSSRRIVHESNLKCTRERARDYAYSYIEKQIKNID